MTRPPSHQILTSAASAKSYPNAKKDPAQARQRGGACEAVLVAALAGLAPMALRPGGQGEATDQVMPRAVGK